MFRTWNMKLSESWQQSFHPGCQSCILLVYMNSLWAVDIRSDITWRETLFEPWREIFCLFVKTALYVSKGTLWVNKQLLKVLIFFKHFRFLNERSPCLAKKFSAGISNMKIAVFVAWDLSKNQTFESSLFFQILQNFERTITVLGGTLFGRDIKNENCSLRLKRSIKKPNFWKISFFSNSSELWTNNYRARRKIFRQGYQKGKLQSSSQKINQKTKLLENLFFFKFFRTLNEHLPCLAKNFSAGISKLKIAVFVPKDQSKNQTSESSLFFQFLQKFERTFTVLGEKFFGGDIKIENCSLRLIRSNKKWNFWKITFFSKSSELWTNIYRAWRKSFGQVYQNWKLYSMSSEYQFGDKINFLNVL